MRVVAFRIVAADDKHSIDGQCDSLVAVPQIVVTVETCAACCVALGGGLINKRCVADSHWLRASPLDRESWFQPAVASELCVWFLPVTTRLRRPSLYKYVLGWTA